MTKVHENQGNTNISLSNRNVFDKAFDDFQEASETSQLFDFFQDRTFWNRTKKIATAFVILTIICNVISALTESVFLFDILNKGLGYWIISVALTVVLVVVVEVIKRATLPDFFKHAFQYGKIDFINLSIYLIFAAISITLSFKGGALIPAAISSPTLIDVDSVDNKYIALMTAKEAEIDSYFDKNNWQGKLDNSSRPTYNLLIAERNNLFTEHQNQLVATNDKNDVITNEHNVNTANDGITLGWITVICEGLFLLMYSFLIYRKYRHFSQFAMVQNHQSHQKVIDTVPTISNQNYEIAATTQVVETPTPVVRKIGFRYGENNDTRKEKQADNSTRKEGNNSSRKEGNRECEYCGNLFVYKVWNHKYCSDKCRISNWEKKNNKELPSYKKESE